MKKKGRKFIQKSIFEEIFGNNVKSEEIFGNNVKSEEIYGNLTNILRINSRLMASFL